MIQNKGSRVQTQVSSISLWVYKILVQNYSLNFYQQVLHWCHIYEKYITHIYFFEYPSLLWLFKLQTLKNSCVIQCWFVFPSLFSVRLFCILISIYLANGSLIFPHPWNLKFFISEETIRKGLYQLLYTKYTFSAKKFFYSETDKMWLTYMMVTLYCERRHFLM